MERTVEQNLKSVSRLCCPHCGAPLPLSATGTVICSFCDSTITIEDSDLDLETPKSSVHKSEPTHSAPASGAELANQLEELLGPIEEQNKILKQIHTLNTKIQSVKAEQEKLRHPSTKKQIGLPLLVLFVSGLWLAAVEGPPIFSILFALIAVLLLGQMRKRRVRAQQNNITLLEKKLAESVAELKKLNQTYPLNLIPENYQAREPVTYFIQALRNGQALSLSQAINLYEDELHRKKVYQFQAEQLNVQRRQMELQRKQLEEERVFHEQQLELSKQKKTVDLGSVLTTVGSVAIIAHTIKKRMK